MEFSNTGRAIPVLAQRDGKTFDVVETLVVVEGVLKPILAIAMIV